MHETLISLDSPEIKGGFDAAEAIYVNDWQPVRPDDVEVLGPRVPLPEDMTSAQLADRSWAIFGANSVEGILHPLDLAVMSVGFRGEDFAENRAEIEEALHNTHHRDPERLQKYLDFRYPFRGRIAGAQKNEPLQDVLILR